MADSYQWVAARNSDHIRSLMSDQAGKTLIAVGSGGSLSTAEVAVALHRHYHQSPAIAMTPLELEASTPKSPHTSVWLFSGSGRNVDIRRALRACAAIEDIGLTIFCARLSSPLEMDARKLYVDRLMTFDTELGKDGFLATNSLLASAGLLASAFIELPNDLNALIKSAGTLLSDPASKISVQAALEDRPYVIILHGPSGKAGALDLESKFSESAIVSSSVTDYRNFAHGRHNWINRFGRETAIIAFLGPGEETLAERTLEIVPKSVPRSVISLGTDFALAQILAVHYSIQITDWVAELHALDPGRPKIPSFGRKLYNLPTRMTRKSSRLPASHLYVARKRSALGAARSADDDLQDWKKSYTAYRRKLRAAEIRAIVLDFDGTVVAKQDRFDPPTAAISRKLQEIARAGLPIGY